MTAQRVWVISTLRAFRDPRELLHHPQDQPSSRFRILIVDDMSEIRTPLQHYLGRLCPESVRSAPSAAEAIALLEQEPAELIIADLRMPGRDGLSLLAEVQRRWPATTRILLTAQSQWEMALAAVPFCHQFLSKPTELQHLDALVARLRQSQSLNLPDSLLSGVGGLSTLPSSAGPLADIERRLSQRDVRSPELAAVVRRDPAMSVRVLQIANAAFFGGGSRLSDVDGAVSLMGSAYLSELHAQCALACAWRPAHPELDFDLDRICRHALVVATLAKSMFRDPRAAEAAYSAGLLHVVGWIAMAASAPAFLTECLARPASLQDGLPERLGAHLLTVWGLPSSLIAATVASHEDPSEESFTPGSAVYLARKLAAIVATPLCGPVVAEPPLSDAFVIRHQLANALPAFLDRGHDAVASACRSLSPLPPMQQQAG